jgi:hypothetical protein
MEKRQFLKSTAGLLAGAGSVLSGSMSSAHAAADKKEVSQTILTIVGDVLKTNRGSLDPVKDQLMYKRGIQFNKGFTFDLGALEKLRSKTISPTMEYDARVHKLSGPRLLDVLTEVGFINSKNVSILMHGIDGYSPEVTLAEVKKYDFILATQIDGQLLSIGGFGPLFGIYDADRIEELTKKPLNQRFLKCPWGLYCIEVKAG